MNWVNVGIGFAFGCQIMALFFWLHQLAVWLMKVDQGIDWNAENETATDQVAVRSEA